MNLLKFTLLIFSLGLFSSCDKLIKEGNKAYMPQANGAMGEIILVIDSAQWNSRVGSELRKTFQAVVPGLPQDEPLFKLFNVNPLKFYKTLKQSRNIIFVTVLNDNSKESRALKGYFTNESLEMIREDENLFMFTKRDDFARGQHILHLFGKDKETLIANIQANRTRIQDYFEKIETDYLKTKLFESENKPLESLIEEKYNFSIRVPYGYELAKEEESFLWIRQLEYPEEKSFFIYHEPYLSADIFNKEAVVELRNKITRKLVRDVENQDIFMMLQEEKYMPYFTKEVSLNGNYAFELRGLWKLNDISAGGPFVSYTTVDEKLGRLYYIEGYVYHPSGDKRDWMREMDTILKTFQVSDQGASASTD